MRSARIDQPRPVDGARRRASASPVTGSDFTRFLSGSEPEAAEQTGATPGVVGLESLLGVQEVGEDGANGRRRAAAEYGKALLDHLDQLRLELLDGGPSPGSMGALARTLRAERRRSDDPALDGLLDEIELRAEIELAKSPHDA